MAKLSAWSAQPIPNKLAGVAQVEALKFVFARLSRDAPMLDLGADRAINASNWGVL
jgi:hypothetical protein